jgi:hypothetical protein
MQLRMTLAELGMSSVPSILPIPRIGQSIDAHGVAIEPLPAIAMEPYSPDRTITEH